MRFVGNIIWFILGGWYISLLWLLGAVVFAISIIGMPFTRSAIEMARLSGTLDIFSDPRSDFVRSGSAKIWVQILIARSKCLNKKAAAGRLF